jgi:hypothetical protein
MYLHKNLHLKVHAIFAWIKMNKLTGTRIAMFDKMFFLAARNRLGTLI